MMIKAIEELQRYHSRMTTVLNELETLEDGENVDYTPLLMGYRNTVNILENRREQLQKSGRHI